MTLGDVLFLLGVIFRTDLTIAAFQKHLKTVLF